MNLIMYVGIGFVVGALLGVLVFKLLSNLKIQTIKTENQKVVANFEREKAENNAIFTEQSKSLNEKLENQKKEIEKLTDNTNRAIDNFNNVQRDLASTNANLKATEKTLTEKQTEISNLKDENAQKQDDNNSLTKSLATATANNEALQDKLDTQKKEIEELGKKFNTEFENIASKILETNTEKFTEKNKINMNEILNPLGKNIDEFKKLVNESYDKESKERFSLSERVKDLADLNKTISEDAKNLTNALKGNSKTQGCWGEMILETILEKSGLRKDEEYFMEYQLKDADGTALRSDSENKKMRPDAVIKYPDQRTLIIDSKVSLNAFLRYTEADDPSEQKVALNEHVKAVKNHVIELSNKGYDDYYKTLDFVLMFIPNEPAFIAALQSDPELWNFAYDKRIILINPTNLIISLKLIADLWKRDSQNKNAQLIADRGAKLYDKFVSFISNLENVGKYIDKSKNAYDTSYKQLCTGNDNLVTQATKLKDLGIKNKKEINTNLVENSNIAMLSKTK